MMGHSTIGVAALLSTAALGYFVCIKANAEKKGSNIRVIGLGIGSIIIILSLLGALYTAAKTCPLSRKWLCKNQAFMGEMEKGSQMPFCPYHK